MITGIVICCVAAAGIGYREMRLVQQENMLNAIHAQNKAAIKLLLLQANASQTDKSDILLKMAELQKASKIYEGELERIRSERWLNTDK